MLTLVLNPGFPFSKIICSQACGGSTTVFIYRSYDTLKITYYVFDTLAWPTKVLDSSY